MAFKLAEGYVELAPKGFDSVNTAVGGVKANLLGLKAPATDAGRAIESMLGNVGANALSRLASGIVGVGKDMITMAAANRSAQISFEVLTGSAEKSRKLFDDLRKFEARTPLGMSELKDTAKTLLSFGVAVDDVLPTLKMLGDVSGGDANKLRSLALAFGQVSAAGRLTGQDVLQFINAGFNPLQQISQKTGESMSSLRDKMERGQITIDMVKNAFRDATSEGGRFFGLLERQGGEIEGMFNQVTAATNRLMAATGEMAIKQGNLKHHLNTVESSLSMLARNVEGVSSATKEGASPAERYLAIFSMNPFVAYNLAILELAASLNKVAEAEKKVTENTPKGIAVGGVGLKQFADKSLKDAADPNSQKMHDLRAELAQVNAEIAKGPKNRQDQANLARSKTSLESQLADMSGFTRRMAGMKREFQELTLGKDGAERAMLVNGNATKEQLSDFDRMKKVLDDARKAATSKEEGQSFIAKLTEEMQHLQGTFNPIYAELDKLAAKGVQGPQRTLVDGMLREKKRLTDAKAREEGIGNAADRITQLRNELDVQAGRKNQADVDFENFVKEMPHATPEQLDEMKALFGARDAANQRSAPQFIGTADLSKTMQAAVQGNKQEKLLEKANELRQKALDAEMKFHKDVVNDGVKIRGEFPPNRLA